LLAASVLLSSFDVACDIRTCFFRCSCTCKQHRGTCNVISHTYNNTEILVTLYHTHTNNTEVLVTLYHTQTNNTEILVTLYHTHTNNREILVTLYHTHHKQYRDTCNVISHTHKQ
jgi:proteasome lid subunit RPN8/RPN11